MKQDALNWLASRSLRERVLIASATILAAALLVYQSLFVSLAGARSEGQRSYESALTALGEARAAARSADGAAQNPLRASASSVLADSAAAAGFTDAQVTASGPASADITIPAARSQALFDWLELLKSRGLVVTALRVDAATGGHLRVRASLAGAQ